MNLIDVTVCLKLLKKIKAATKLAMNDFEDDSGDT